MGAPMTTIRREPKRMCSVRVNGWRQHGRFELLSRRRCRLWVTEISLDLRDSCSSVTTVEAQNGAYAVERDAVTGSYAMVKLLSSFLPGSI